MFDWLFGRAACPVDDELRSWLDERWAWLEGQFGRSRLTDQPVIEPTDAWFPDPYDRSPAAARVLFTRVQGYMGLADQPIGLDFYTQQDDDPLSWHTPTGITRETSGAAGYFYQTYGGDRPQIRIESSKLDDTTSLVATMAHELGHVHLIGHGRLEGTEEDHEPLTDLLVVFMGLGIFSANSVIRERNWQSADVFGWSVGRLGYLPQEAFGYALAKFARARGEPKPAWADHLCTDVQSYFKQASRFLATADEA